MFCPAAMVLTWAKCRRIALRNLDFGYPRIKAADGLLASLGLFQTIRGILQGKAGSVIFGIILLAGAFVVLYYNVSSDTQGLIRSWVPGL